MTARFLILSTTLMALTAVIASAVIDPPAAPPPRPAGEKAKEKTTADLLVGSWTLVQHNPPFNRPVTATAVFTKEGRFIFRIRTPEVGTNKGKYEVIGKTIRLSSDPSEELPAGKIRTIEIDSISDQELKTVGGPATNRERSVWKRNAGN